MLNRQVVLRGIADGLKSVSPDILCLQEVQGENLKRMLKFNEFPEQSQHEWFGEYLNLDDSYGRNSEYGHGHHGNAVLSRHPLDPKHNVNITVNRLEKRGVLHCEIHPEGWDVPVVVLCAHLNLLEGGRDKQYDAITEYVNDSIDQNQRSFWRVILTTEKGILRETGKPLKYGKAFMFVHDKLLPTFPSRLPVFSLDRIYVRNLTVKKAWVHTGKPWNTLSDHLPISAVVGLVVNNQKRVP